MMLLALAAMLQSAAGTASAYPTSQVLAAFGEVCRRVDDLKKAETDAIGTQWTRFVADAASPLGELIAIGRAEAQKVFNEQSGGSMSDPVTLRREVAGEELFAVLSEVRIGGQTVRGCRVYDIGEARQLTVAEAEKWIGRAPSRQVSEPGIASMATWEPGYQPAHDSFELFFIPAGSPAIETLKVSGVFLKADYVEAATPPAQSER
jgi:hypothetical protein